MGIKVEFNPDLALRAFGTFGRLEDECLPENIESGKIYSFLKIGQRLYFISDIPQWNQGEIPLFETKGNEELSRPLASIKILEATHFLRNGEVWTKGRYKVMEIFDISDPKINFEWMKKIGGQYALE